MRPQIDNRILNLDPEMRGLVATVAKPLQTGSLPRAGNNERYEIPTGKAGVETFILQQRKHGESRIEATLVKIIRELTAERLVHNCQCSHYRAFDSHPSSIAPYASIGPF